MYYGHVYDKFNLNVLEIGGSKYSTKILRSSGHVLWKILRKRLQLNLKRTEYSKGGQLDQLREPHLGGNSRQEPCLIYVLRD
jgi:hypothetical protein